MIFPRILESLPPLPRQSFAANGYTKNYQPIGVTVHSNCVASFEGLLKRSDEGEGGDAVNREKTQFFLNTLYIHFLVYIFIFYLYIYASINQKKIISYHIYRCIYINILPLFQFIDSSSLSLYHRLSTYL